MARARNIKPGFFRNADLVELTMEARLLFIGLWTLADREGRLDDRPKQIKMEIFPADAVDCDALLSGLAATGMVARYEVDGKRYLQVVNFTKHQNPHRDEKPSTIPDACGNLTCKVAAPAKPSAKTVPASSDESASTVFAQCLHGAGTVVIGLNPDPRSLNPESLTHTAVVGQRPEEPDGSVCVLICQKMQEAGIGDANAADAGLAVLVGKGAGEGAFVAAAQAAVGQGKGFAYALGIVKNKMTAAASLAAAPLAKPADRPAKPDVSRVTVEANPDVEATQRRLAEAAARPVSAAPPELRARLAQRRQAGVASGAGAAGVGVAAA